MERKVIIDRLWSGDNTLLDRLIWLTYVLDLHEVQSYPGIEGIPTAYLEEWQQQAVSTCAEKVKNNIPMSAYESVAMFLGMGQPERPELSPWEKRAVVTMIESVLEVMP